ncbi:unnamed protein product [Dovyalis caffra]|uniref:Uncharacterized protein n=1 Tax=Dovyalis caffra TaxID=77055 RepID=A0AAV1S883_9ROSI|nr:unnamed protein product [Dovyalis caffra]
MAITTLHFLHPGLSQFFKFHHEIHQKARPEMLIRLQKDRSMLSGSDPSSFSLGTATSSSDDTSFDHQSLPLLAQERSLVPACSCNPGVQACTLGLLLHARVASLDLRKKFGQRLGLTTTPITKTLTNPNVR